METMYKLYSKTGCPYCEAIERVFKIKGIGYEKLMLGTDYTKEDFISRFGQATFPRVLTEGDEVIGGAQETVAYLKEQGLV